MESNIDKIDENNFEIGTFSYDDKYLLENIYQKDGQ